MKGEINMYDLEKVEYQNERILTTKQLAEFYGATEKMISNNFNRNKKNFVEGRHYYELKGQELKAFKTNHLKEESSFLRINCLYLWTEKGASRHAKILNTVKAWEVFDILEDSYFSKNPTFQTTNPHLEMANQILQTLMRQEREQQRLKSEITNTKIEITKTQDDLQEIRDTIQINPKNWRNVSNQIISQIAKNNSGYKDKGKVYRELYTALNNRLGVNLGTRLRNKKRRMAMEGGISKSRIEATNILDIIGEDKKLIVGYITILKELAIKNGIGIKAQ